MFPFLYGAPDTTCCGGESGGTSRPIDLAERYRFYDLVAEREVIRSGFEPETHSLEGCCSIQLSYRTPAPQRRAKSAQRYYKNLEYTSNYAKKMNFDAFFCIKTCYSHGVGQYFIKLYCQKAGLNPACGMHLRDD